MPLIVMAVPAVDGQAEHPAHDPHARSGFAATQAAGYANHG